MVLIDDAGGLAPNTGGHHSQFADRTTYQPPEGRSTCKPSELMTQVQPSEGVFDDCWHTVSAPSVRGIPESSTSLWTMTDTRVGWAVVEITTDLEEEPAQVTRFGGRVSINSPVESGQSEKIGGRLTSPERRFGGTSEARHSSVSSR